MQPCAPHMVSLWEAPHPYTSCSRSFWNCRLADMASEGDCTNVFQDGIISMSSLHENFSEDHISIGASSLGSVAWIIFSQAAHPTLCSPPSTLLFSLSPTHACICLGNEENSRKCAKFSQFWLYFSWNLNSFCTETRSLEDFGGCWGRCGTICQISCINLK